MVALAALAATLISAAQIPAAAQTGSVDTATSQRLTDYLRKHRLPLVGAQVTRDDNRGTQVMLYGYVATSFGRSDAEARARKFMKPGAQIVNRIEIRPEILHLKSKPAGAGAGKVSTPDDPPAEPPFGNDHRGTGP